MSKTTQEGRGKALSMAHSSLATGGASATEPAIPPIMAPIKPPTGPPNAKPNNPPPMTPRGALEPGAGVGTTPLSYK